MRPRRILHCNDEGALSSVVRLNRPYLSRVTKTPSPGETLKGDLRYAPLFGAFDCNMKGFLERQDPIFIQEWMPMTLTSTECNHQKNRASAWKWPTLNRNDPSLA